MILPGATIGILGGGQLGRMTGMAARTLGYDVHVLDPDPDCPARAVASRVVTARFDDVEAAVDLARGCAVVTLEIEQIGASALDAVAAVTPLRPGPHAVRVVQNRITQREWLSAHDFPVGPFRVVRSEEECAAAAGALGRCIAKAPVGGYDGRGQVRIANAPDAIAAWHALGARPCLVEQFLDLELECSVLVARHPAVMGGATVAFPAARNHHEHGVLDWSVLPAGLPGAREAEAVDLATRIATALGIEGLLAVEMFVTRDGRLLVNELAPRPHNTYHHTERGCETSQFEQLVRAVCGLPLGNTASVAPAAIANLLGDLWTGDTAPDFAAALRERAVRLHLYGKASARPGRKMGHLSAVAATTDDALRHVLDARDAMRRR